MPLRRHQKEVGTPFRAGILLRSLKPESCYITWTQGSMPCPVGLPLETSQDRLTMTMAVILFMYLLNILSW